MIQISVHTGCWHGGQQLCLLHHSASPQNCIFFKLENKKFCNSADLMKENTRMPSQH